LQTALPNRLAPSEHDMKEKIDVSVAGQETATIQDARSPLGPGYYFQRDEVERMPHIVADIADENLEAKFEAHASGGRLVLELWINEQGVVDKVDTLESTQTPELAQLIIASLQKQVFPSPAPQPGGQKSFKKLKSWSNPSGKSWSWNNCSH